MSRSNFDKAGTVAPYKAAPCRKFTPRKTPSGPCAAEGCDRGAIITSGGGRVCNLHYQRWRLHGSFDLPKVKTTRDRACAHCKKPFDVGYAVAQSRKNVFCSSDCKAAYAAARAQSRQAFRFWAKVRKSEGCWEWMGRKSTSGYGMFTLHGRRSQAIASRVSYELTYGGFDESLFVCHHCDNPACVRPDHLFLGTPQDNVDDCIQKGRFNGFPVIRRGEDSNKAKITAADALLIYRSNKPAKSLAAQYGITTTAVYLIKRGKNWWHVTGGGR